MYFSLLFISLKYFVFINYLLDSYGSTEPVPLDYDALSDFKCLRYATKEEPLYLFLDSLDQLVEQDYALGKLS